MKILAINSGSSSLKYQLFEKENNEPLVQGIIERIGETNSVIEYKVNGKKTALDFHCPTHHEAIDKLLTVLLDKEIKVIQSLEEIVCITHRVVHGGEMFKKSVIVTDEVIAKLKSLIKLAPLHNPANIEGIQAFQELLPKAMQVAVFDTAFHQTMPPKAYMYPIPYEWYEKEGVRRYGMHGTSYVYVSQEAAKLLNKPLEECNLIVLHIGNGASFTAIKNGKSIDTSMGLTPTEGGIMGTRCGDIDPMIPLFMQETRNLSVKQVSHILNKESGIKGITEKYIDRRDVEKTLKTNPRSKLIFDMESYIMRKYIGSFAFALGRVDAIVFTAGVGENAPLLRKNALTGLEMYGITLDEERNQKAFRKSTYTKISSDSSNTQIYVIPTNEELMMVKDAIALMDQK